MTDYESELQETGAIKGKEFVELEEGGHLDICELCCFGKECKAGKIRVALNFCYFHPLGGRTVFGIWVEEE